VGRRVDESSPLVDARLPDGSRVNAAIPPVAVDGPLLSIRRFGRHALKGEDLVAKMALTEGMLELLKACVKARLNILICGGTGSGKTTLLNALSSYIPEDERIVTIEDAAELQMHQEHVCRLESRPPDVRGEGRISIRDLVINALRMRPDRIVVGEVRGGEALDMLQAMNTGHDGSMTTVHANTPRDSLSRLETQVLMGGVELPSKAIRQQIASAINIIVQLNRLRDGSRRITAISEVVGMEGDTITMQDIFMMKAEGLDQQGNLKNDFELTGVRPQILDRLFDMGLAVPPEISRLFPDRRTDQVAAIRLPTPPPGPLQRRLG
jgi:pilus assembly protein CpaF